MAGGWWGLGSPALSADVLLLIKAPSLRGPWNIPNGMGRAVWDIRVKADWAMSLLCPVGNGVSVQGSVGLMMLRSKAHCWFCNALLCPRWHGNVSLMEARAVLLKDARENAKGNFCFSCSWGGWPRKGKHKGVLTFTHKYIFYCLWGWWSWWREVTESLPRKIAILKQSCPVQRKRTTTERTAFQLENLDGSLRCFSFESYF